MNATDGAARFDPVEDAMGVLRRNAAEMDANPLTRPAFGERVIARIADLILFGVVLIVVVYIHQGLTRPAEDAAGPNPNSATVPEDVIPIVLGPVPITPGFLLDIGIIFACLVAYEVGTTLLLGRTPGKRWMGIRIVAEEDTLPVTLARLLTRTVIWTLPAALLIGCWFLSVTYGWLSLAVIAVLVLRTARDANERGPHEHATGTMLLNDSAHPEQPASGASIPQR